MNKYFQKQSGEQPQNNKRLQEAILSDWTFQKYKESMLSKEVYVKNWRKYIDAYNGDYFKNTTRPEYKSNQISNMIYALVESMRPIMADEEVSFDVLPRTEKGAEKCDVVNKALNYEFDREGMRYKILQDLIPCLQLGTSIFYVGWNADKGDTGEVECKVINPFNFFPDPLAQSIDECEYVIYATYKHVNQLKKEFPDSANLLEGGDVKYKELVSNREQEGFKTDTQVLVLECWCRDYTYIDVEEEVNGEVVKGKKRAYPNGRIITTAPEFQVVLSDRENPYKDGKFPFVLHKDIDVPFEFWGKGEIEQLLSPQEYANELNNQIIDNAKNTANMQWVLDKNSGIGQGVLTNRPGLVVRKNPGTEVRRDTPPSMPVYVRETVEVLKQDMETISGVHEVTQGVRPTGIQAGNAILALQEAGQSRIRLKIKIMEGALAEVAKMWYSRMKQFWLQERFIRVASQTQEDSTTIKGQQFEFVKVKREDFKEDYDIKIVSCATMAKNKSALLDLFIRLAQTPAEDGLPMLDRETVLQYAPIPNRAEILARFKEVKDENVQMQVQQAQEQAQMVTQQFGQQMQQMGEMMKELTQTVQQLNQEVNKIQVEHEKLKEEEMKREIENKGYERGANDLKLKFLEAMEAREDESMEYGDESELAGLSDEDVPVSEKDIQLSDEMLMNLDKLNPDELQQILQMYPMLAEQIMGEIQGMQQQQMSPQIIQ